MMEQNGNNSRDAVIIRTSIIGIIANVFLAAFKAFVGLASNSIAIVMDAVNNLSDAASSIITIVGTKLAGKEPDKEHPFGYGRIEYMSAMVISVLVLYAGATAFTESVKKIIRPDVPDYSAVSLIIVAVAVVVKILLGRYVKSVGEKVNSDSLIDSGKDATLDSVISASTLVAAAIYLTTGISLEAWLGAGIAVVIIKSGIDMLRETISRILGERADAELAKNIKASVVSQPEISGAYDLVLHDYGPDSYNGSIHIEVPDTMNADDLDKLIRKVTDDVYQKCNVLLTGVGIYAVNTRDPEAADARSKVITIAKSHEFVQQVHGFYIDKENKILRLDIVVSFDAPDRRKVYDEVRDEVQAAFPDYKLYMTLDAELS